MTWNGHGDAAAIWKIDPSTGALTLANDFIYTTWGTPTTTTHNGIADLGFRFQYVGRSGVAWDNMFGLGLQLMGARHYSPTLGRFLQPDPAHADGNLYVYAADSPLSRIDPTGMACEYGNSGYLCIDFESMGYGDILLTAWGHHYGFFGIEYAYWRIAWYNYQRYVGGTDVGGALVWSNYWHHENVIYTGRGTVSVALLTWIATLYPFGWAIGVTPILVTRTVS